MKDVQAIPDHLLMRTVLLATGSEELAQQAGYARAKLRAKQGRECNL